MTGSAFSVLFVCTGNFDRSPVAEIVTRHLLDKRLGVDAGLFQVASAGTAAITGTPMDSGSHAALAARGLDLAAQSFRARRLDSAMVAGANLVLTAERCHRRLVVGLRPSALSKTFCVRELIRLLVGAEWHDPPAGLVQRALDSVAMARQRRGVVGGAGQDADALPDPRADAARYVDLIAATCWQLVDLLAPSAAAQNPRPEHVAQTHGIAL